MALKNFRNQINGAALKLSQVKLNFGKADPIDYMTELCFIKWMKSGKCIGSPRKLSLLLAF